MYGRKRAPFVVGIAANGSRLSIGERLWGGEKVPSGIFVVSSFYAMTVARSLEPRHGLESPSFFSQTQERNEKPIIIIIMKKNTSIGRRSPLSVGCPHLPSSSDTDVRRTPGRSLGVCARTTRVCLCRSCAASGTRRLSFPATSSPTVRDETVGINPAHGRVWMLSFRSTRYANGRIAVRTDVYTAIAVRGDFERKRVR